MEFTVTARVLTIITMVVQTVGPFRVGLLRNDGPNT